MDIERFKQLKQQATITLHELDMLTGGDVVHERERHRLYIRYRIDWIEENGEKILYYKLTPLDYTLNGLEQKLKEANQWIVGVKLRGR